MRITGVTPDDLENAPITHYEMMQQIEEWCAAKGPSIFIGHNSIGFDEVMMRQALYQNLRPPYLTNTNGNSRADVRLMAETYFHHAPDAINVPDGPRGTHVFKLGPLARANGIDLAEEAAHDALADVRATLNLAQFLRGASPDLWHHLVTNADKNDVDAFLDANPVCYASFFYGGRPYSYLVTEAARSERDDKEVALFDLTNDPVPYLDMEVAQLVGVLQESPKKVRTVRSNQQPMLLPYEMPSPHLRGQNPGEQVLRDRAETIKNAEGFRARLSTALPLRYGEREPSPHVEERLYDGFFTEADKVLMTRFHQEPWENRADIGARFEDGRLRELGMRLVCDHDEALAPEDARETYRQWIRGRNHTNEDVEWMTVSKALTEIDDLERENPDDAAIFGEMREYIVEIGGTAED